MHLLRNKKELDSQLKKIGAFLNIEKTIEGYKIMNRHIACMSLGKPKKEKWQKKKEKIIVKLANCKDCFDTRNHSQNETFGSANNILIKTITR